MQKQEKIVKMFDEIAPTYDVANRVLSLGIDLKWRKEACDFMLERFSKSSVDIADVACGTGDMMKIWSDSSIRHSVTIKSMVGIDPSEGMLEQAKKKFPNFNFIKAYANETTLESNSIDILSISYGIRNVIQRKEALREFNRVLKDNGYVVVLEFARRTQGGFLGRLRDFYLTKILPKIGGIISKNKEAYEYLPNSIEGFLDSTTFCDELRIYGFEIILCKSFSADISTLFVAKKIKAC